MVESAIAQKVPNALLELPRQSPLVTPPPGIRQAAELNALTVNTACHWLNKRLGAKIRIPEAKTLRDATKVLGSVWFYEIFQCCERMDSLIKRAQAGSANWLDRFEDVINEFYVQGIVECILSLYEINAEDFTSYTGKSLLIAQLNSICTRVSNESQGDDQKPPHASAFEICPEFAGFITAGMDLANTNTGFRGERWRPMLKAWRAAIAEMDKHYAMHHVYTTKVLRQGGKGKHLINLTPAYLKQIATNSKVFRETL